MIADITEFLVQNLRDVFETKKSVGTCGDECDNLNFMNSKTNSFKIRKNLRILGNF